MEGRVEEEKKLIEEQRMEEKLVDVDYILQKKINILLKEYFLITTLLNKYCTLLNVTFCTLFVVYSIN